VQPVGAGLRGYVEEDDDRVRLRAAAAAVAQLEAEARLVAVRVVDRFHVHVGIGVLDGEVAGERQRACRRRGRRLDGSGDALVHRWRWRRGGTEAVDYRAFAATSDAKQRDGAQGGRVKDEVRAGVVLHSFMLRRPR